MVKPESLMMSHGYKPEWSEGSIKCPIFQTSTFVFKSAEEGKAFFELAYGKRKAEPNEQPGLIYSRLNNPDIQILEERLCLWDNAEAAAVFESGMSAISTVFMEFLKPGDLLLYGTPTYGGTDHFIREVLPKWGVHTMSFDSFETEESIMSRLKNHHAGQNLGLIYIESPANPTNAFFDLQMCRSIADRIQKEVKKVERIPVAMDNTYLGPIWQSPLDFGVDIIVYSATKFLGGHSDLIAGAVLGSNEWINRVKVLRTFLGNMAGPWTGWLLMRSLETLKIRMERQANTAQMIATWLSEHPKVSKVFYPTLLEHDSIDYVRYKKYAKGPGSMISFEINGAEKEAFSVLNNLKLAHLAVSLGSTESLVQHPATMTHCDMPEVARIKLGITDSLIRYSVGVEDPDDLIADLAQSLDHI